MPPPPAPSHGLPAGFGSQPRVEEGAGGRRPDGRGAVWSDFERAWVMVAELVAATLLWGAIGWLADGRLGTGPWLLVAGLLVGNATGTYLVWRRSGGADPDHGAPEQPGRRAEEQPQDAGDVHRDGAAPTREGTGR